MLSRKKDSIEIDDFQIFSSLSGTLGRFSIKIDGFGFDFHKISLSRIGETS